MQTKKVLFICINNSARSQMAEAYMNILSEGKYIAESAGLESGDLNPPFAIRAMAEDGIDISQKNNKFSFRLFLKTAAFTTMYSEYVTIMR